MVGAGEVGGAEDQEGEGGHGEAIIQFECSEIGALIVACLYHTVTRLSAFVVLVFCLLDCWTGITLRGEGAIWRRQS